MMKIIAYFIFPETDVDILMLGDDPNVYKELISEVASVKRQLKNHKDFELCYDSENVDCFWEKAESLLGGNYLYDCKKQLRKLFGNHSTNVKVTSMCNPECIYAGWDISCTEIQVNRIISEVSEATLNEKLGKTVLVDMTNAYSTSRDAVHVIKDAVHIEGLPVMIVTPTVCSVADFAEWYASISNTEFTLKDKRKFEKTNFRWNKEAIYKCLKTGYFWYFDYFHRENKWHFEVFDTTGIHLGEANENGVLKKETADKNKTISQIIS